MRVAVAGCIYGELDRVYRAVQRVEERHGVSVDLLIVCGDFQAVRDEEDLETTGIPQKFKALKDFHRYYHGEKKAPVLTLIVGGSHEPPAWLREHYYGGWVAERIYYFGYAGVVRVGPLRIAGLSGIFRAGNYFTPHHERPPYTEETRRSAYSVRDWDVARLEHLGQPVDILVSQDWPRGIWKHGNAEPMLSADERHKSDLRRDMESNALGSPAAMELLRRLRPAFWFAGHPAAKFAALVPHDDGTFSRFLALEKCTARHDFLQVLDIDPQSPSFLRKLPGVTETHPLGYSRWKDRRRLGSEMRLHYDPVWLAIQKVNHEHMVFSTSNKHEKATVVPPTREDVSKVIRRLREAIGAVPFDGAKARRHPKLLPTKLREAGDAVSLRELSMVQLRELFETRGLDFPGHLDKASIVRQLEEHDEFFAAERNTEHEASNEAFPIPESFEALPSNAAEQRRALLEILELDDLWREPEEKGKPAEGGGSSPLEQDALDFSGEAATSQPWSPPLAARGHDDEGDGGLDDEDSDDMADEAEAEPVAEDAEAEPVAEDAEAEAEEEEEAEPEAVGAEAEAEVEAGAEAEYGEEEAELEAEEADHGADDGAQPWAVDREEEQAAYAEPMAEAQVTNAFAEAERMAEAEAAAANVFAEAESLAEAEAEALRASEEAAPEAEDGEEEAAVEAEPATEVEDEAAEDAPLEVEEEAAEGEAEADAAAEAADADGDADMAAALAAAFGVLGGEAEEPPVKQRRVR